MKVTLISHTPDPERVCNRAAGVCVSAGEVKGDKHLMHALASGHDSVLEHATFTFAIEGISRACSHQLVRHRMASYSQQSQRYVNMDGFDYVVPESIRTSTVELYDNVVQEYPEEDVPLGVMYCRMMELISSFYSIIVERGIPEEDARYILPNACTTNIIVTMNARELRHFFSLRLCTRAQWEIRQLAEKMLDCVREVAPALFEDAGPRCKALGFCPESKGCGRMPKKVVE